VPTTWYAIATPVLRAYRICGVAMTEIVSHPSPRSHQSWPRSRRKRPVRGKKLALLYYNYPNANCTTATCQLNVAYAASTDGGSSWSASTQLAGPMSLNWLPNTSQGFMVGDYFSTSFLGTRNFPAFALANAPTGSVFDEAIYTIQGGLGTGSAVRTVTDHVDASGSVTLTTSRITDQ
jgi:hypothetical protein